MLIHDNVIERDQILKRAGAELAAVSGVTGIFLCGSLADDTADSFSDIDLRVVCSVGEYSNILASRAQAPAKWGNFLFHEMVGAIHTVSYFEPLNKVDVFYYSESNFKPSAWYSMPVSIIFDPEGLIKKNVEASAKMSFAANSAEVEKLLSKAIACLHESAKRTARSELIYGSRLAILASDYLMYLDDELASRPGYGPSKFEHRCTTTVAETIQSISALTCKEGILSYIGSLAQLTSQSIEETTSKGLIAADLGANFDRSIQFLQRILNEIR